MQVNAEFEAKLVALEAAMLRHHGLQARRGHVLRSPWVQARIWRQSRTAGAVRSAIDQLEKSGAPWLASVLEGVGPQPTGPWVTNALPGAGWHQWGEAADFYFLRPDGSINWDGEDRRYLLLGAEAARLGLEAGRFWAKPDPGHVQLQRAGGATDVHSWAAIDAALKAAWGEVEK